MSRVRKALRISAVIGAALVALVVIALVVTQTAWFRDWLRRYAIREAAQVVNGQLVIGRLDGGLWNGVQLHDVRIEQGGETVVGLATLTLDYRLLDFIREGIVVRRVDIVEPRIALRREGETWNLADLLVLPDEPTDPDAPMAQFRVDHIELTNGLVTITDPDCPAGTRGCLPSRIERLHARARVESADEGLTVQVHDLSLVTVQPDLVLRRLTADVQTTDSTVDVRSLDLQTEATSLSLRARVEDYADAPRIDARLTGDPISLEEIARFVPQLEGHTLAPVLTLEAQGPLDALRLVLDVTSDAGYVRADVVADAAAPSYGVRGSLGVQQLDLSQLLLDPEFRSVITATADVDVTGTDVASLQGDVAVQARDVRAMTYQAEALDLRATMVDGVADVQAAVRAYGAQATTAGRVTYAQVEAGVVAYDVTGSLRSLQLNRLPASLGVPPLASSIALDFEAAGDLENVRARVDMQRSTVGDAVIGADTTATVTLNDGRLAYVATGSVANLNLQQIGDALDIDVLRDDLYASDLRATFEVDGQGTDLDTLAARARMSLAPSSVGALRIASLDVDARIDRGALHTTLAGRVENVRPELYTGRDDLAGALAGRFDVTASIPDVTGDIAVERVSVDARIDLDPAELAGVRLDELRLDARLVDGAGEVRTLQLSSAIADVSVNGPLSLVASSETRLRYEVDVKDAGALAALADVEGVAGTARTDGVVTGWLQQLAVEGDLAADDLVYSETGSVERLRATYAARVSELDVAQAAADVRGTITGIDASGTPIDRIELTAAYAADRATFDTDITHGDLSLGIGGVVDIEEAAQDLTLNRLEARGGELNWSLAPGAQPRVRHADNTVAVSDLRLASGTQRLAVAGVVALPGDETPLRLQDVQVDASAIDVAPIARQFADEDVAGRLDASVRATGTLDAGQAALTLSLRDGEARGFTFEALTASADYDGGVADVDVRLDQSSQASLRATGRVPVAALANLHDASDGGVPDEFDLIVESTPIDLALVDSLTSMVTDVSGRMALNARVTGPAAQPIVDGTFTVQEGRFRVPLTGVAYQALEADVQVTGEMVRVRQLGLQDPKGNRLDVAGSIALRDGAPGDVELNLTASRVQVLDGRMGDVAVTADLAVSGSAQAPVVRGSVTVPGGRVDVDHLLAALNDLDEEQLRDDVDLVYVPPVPAPASSESPEPLAQAADAVRAEDQRIEPAASAEADDGGPSAIDAATIDVTLEIPASLVLRADDLRVAPEGPGLGAMNVTLGADLRAQQTPGEPLILTGDITFVRGQYDFQGRRFLVARDSAIRFQGPDPTNPTLDITALRQISGVEARMHLEGPAQEPRLRLSSDPSLDEADILALIVFDRPLDELGQGEQVSVARRAGELLGGRITGTLATSLRDALDVDLLEIDAFGEGGPAVTVGNQLGERLFVRFRQQVGASDTTQILLEYALLGNLRLQTSVTQGAQTDRSPGQRVERSGIDLLYFFVY